MLGTGLKIILISGAFFAPLSANAETCADLFRISPVDMLSDDPAYSVPSYLRSSEVEFVELRSMAVFSVSADELRVRSDGKFQSWMFPYTKFLDVGAGASGWLRFIQGELENKSVTRIFHDLGIYKIRFNFIVPETLIPIYIDFTPTVGGSHKDDTRPIEFTLTTMDESTTLRFDSRGQEFQKQLAALVDRERFFLRLNAALGFPLSVAVPLGYRADFSEIIHEHKLMMAMRKMRELRLVWVDPDAYAPVYDLNFARGVMTAEQYAATWGRASNRSLLNHGRTRFVSIGKLRVVLPLANIVHELEARDYRYSWKTHEWEPIFGN